jgi:hypothetical protein
MLRPSTASNVGGIAWIVNPLYYTNYDEVTMRIYKLTRHSTIGDLHSFSAVPRALRIRVPGALPSQITTDDEPGISVPKK